jgi:hypothetical protein
MVVGLFWLNKPTQGKFMLCFIFRFTGFDVFLKLFWLYAGKCVFAFLFVCKAIASSLLLFGLAAYLFGVRRYFWPRLIELAGGLIQKSPGEWIRVVLSS